MGDGNTRYFYYSFKANKRGIQFRPLWILQELFKHDAFVNHFKSILSPHIQAHPSLDLTHLPVTGTVNEEEGHFTVDEIEDSIKRTSAHKAPGPDGFNGHFFKVCWSIIGKVVSNAIIDVFNKGRLLQQVNNTFITLIPKVENPSSLADFRPISLANEVYKIISRILA